ncbi:wings apart-like protein regulation of heterochromatin-domain-containing protein [Immersiella caudata]|uniref:Wings apart-like protein regulation of heterochromatin-domain-containing protein n=1 Tax=Immersiella caudata TaxID=314043 RepID=A0AA39X3N7_9PEZI|nr:wings apart-like protein regulation of heterochromatin-domain-containing protein [Immersiella caudata]
MSDYDFPPKKRVTTYGKTARRRLEPSPNGLSKGGDSIAEVSAASSAASTSRSGSPEPRPRSRPPTSASKAKLLGAGNAAGRRARAIPKMANDSNSQPLPSSYSLGDGLEDDEDGGLKKRKLTRTYSEKNISSVDPYDFPDSPPPKSRPLVKRGPPKIVEEDVTPKPRRVAKPVAAVRGLATPGKDVDMEDADEPEILFSAKTTRALDRLSVSRDSPPKAKQQIPLRLSREPATLAPPASRKRPSPPPSSSGSRSAVNPGPRKKRLIDALAQQAEEESEGEEGEDGEEEEEYRPFSQKVEAQALPRPMLDLNFRDESPPASKAPRNVALSGAVATKTTGPKFTYSERRTMLQEDDFMLGGLGGIEEEPTNGAMFNFGRLPPVSTSSKFSFLDEDDETVNTGAVRSLHELRQAGANSRFADEMDDIMDRIGSPLAKTSSLRRGALLELAQKLMKKEFRQQFRNHGDDGNLFKSIGEETDVISGYSLLAIFVTLLAASSSAHLVQELRAHNFAALLARLLGEVTDITPLTKDRKQNASKNAQNTLASIKSSLLTLPIWEPCSPISLSPRTLALKCLDLIMLQPGHTSGETEIFSPGVTDVLFSILSTAHWDTPFEQEQTDLYLALYLLEGKSISAMQSSLGPRWTRQYVPTAVNILEKALRRPVDKINKTENLALRLALNTTNSNLEAARMFSEQGLLQELAVSACDAFDAVLKSMKADAFLKDIYENLIMMLGVMVNFIVYYPPASHALDQGSEQESNSSSPLDRLIRVFADHHSTTSDADSIEKSQLNVALGYLSILLGYLCTYDPIRERFLLVHPKKTLQPLLDSINEFIIVNHKAAEAQQSQFGATARLQNLLAQLQA